MSYKFKIVYRHLGITIWGENTSYIQNTCIISIINVFKLFYIKHENIFFEFFEK